MWKIVNRQTKEVVLRTNNEEDLKGYRKWPFQIIHEESIMNIHVKIKKLTDTAKIPTQADAGAAGYDLYADIKEPVIIAPHTTEKISTGIAVEMPIGYFGAIFARSGLATKKGLRPANAVGVCDPSYRGEYIVALHNDGLVSQTVEPGERIAQLIFLPYAIADIEEASELTETERGEGGFGSTGRT